MATPYKPVSWGNEYISSDKLNMMASNDQYLYERMPTVYYRSYGVRKKSGGMKIAAGTVFFSANKKVFVASQNYHFGNYFSQGCKPVVTTGMSMTSGGFYHVVVRGLSGARGGPDHRGMNIKVIANSSIPSVKKINHPMNIHWIAVGY